MTADAVLDQGIDTVALLGTKYVMQGDFYLQKLKDSGLKVLTPDEADQNFIHEAIYGELTKNQFLPETRDRFLEIIAKLEKQGVQGVILGCTEIPILIKREDCLLTLFDTTKLHAAAAVARATEHSAPPRPIAS